MDSLRKNILAATLLPLLLGACSGSGSSPSGGNSGTGGETSATKTYYVDSSTGDDSNDGLSEKKPWKTLAKASEAKLSPGDRLLLKCGGTFTGQLQISARGTSSSPIEVGSYGSGSAPVIQGEDESPWAVRILNSSYLTLSGLEIVNTGSKRLAGRTGLKIECRDGGVSRKVTVKDLFIHDVNGSLVKSEGGGSAILVENGGTTTASKFDSLTIRDCHILRCERNAMIWASEYYDRNNWLPSTNTVVSGNLIEEVPGDGIVPLGCDSTRVEYNVMRSCPETLPDTEAAAGIWPWSCDNTLIQFNEVSGHKAPWDAQGYDCDYNCRNTTIQYNYSHDNYGGMVLICDSGKERTYSLGNKGSVVRHNLSIGDGIRPKPASRGEMFSPMIHIAGRTESTLVEGNIIHSNKKNVDNADRRMIVSDSWDGYADQTTFKGNVFYSAETSSFSMGESTHNTFSGNWYLGAYSSYPEDATAKKSSYYYEKNVLDKDSEGFKGLSSLLVKRTLFGVECHYVDRNAFDAFLKAMEE